MFNPETYSTRRNILKKQIKSGIILFPGNEESPMNYTANTYHFRQDSSFLYYFGLDVPGLAALIDIDNDQEIIFGYEFTVDDIVWMGPQEPLSEKAKKAGVKQAMPLEKLEELIKNAIGSNRQLHYLPQYRHDTIIKLEKLSGIHNSEINKKASEDLIKAIVSQRSYKTGEEIKEIELALDISYDMNTLAMKMSKPGIFEYEVSGAVAGVALSRNSVPSFPIIFSSQVQVLHGHSHDNIMNEGGLLVLDSGAESPLHYASDITRTYPVSGKFTGIQRDIYNVVFLANTQAIAMMKPDVLFRDVHLHAAKVIADGMKQLGFMKGDTDEAVAAGAHALFFPHGLGHQMGLDVHDMENLGEDYVGYDETVKRSDQFGFAYLRFGRKLEPGIVLTIEPGVYFMPELINLWKSENKFTDFINYEKIEENIGFTGVRIEDDIVITEDGHCVLGKPIPKTVEEVEESCAAS